MISQTKCKAALINMCILHIPCCFSAPECQDYIKDMTRFSGINLTINKFASALPNMNIGECMVLQITSMPQGFSVAYRWIRLAYGGSKPYTCEFHIYSCNEGAGDVTYDKSVPVRHSDNRNEFKVYAHSVHYSRSNSFFKNISEPRMPRATHKNELRSGTVINGTGCLRLDLKNTAMHSWIELEIQATAKYSSPSGFAVDYIFKNKSTSITKYPGNPRYGIFVLKLSSKVSDQDVILKVRIGFKIEYKYATHNGE